MRQPVIRIAAAVVAAVGVWTLFAQDGSQSREAAKQRGAGGSALTHISTDKPIYRPGETLYARGLMLDASTRAPYIAAQDETPSVLVKVTGPKGDTVMSGYAVAKDSIVPISWTIPAETPGGTYTLCVEHMTGNAPAERTFEIRAYRPPRIKTQITFARDGYGPSDVVSASLAATRAEGGAPAGARVTTIARIDGEEVYRHAGEIDAAGGCVAEFPLPAHIERGEGVLVMVIEDGGVVETASKTIPILLQTVDLDIYPEGGDLVAGLATRVYFEARTPAQKPADIAGVIVNDRGDTVASFRSEHEGRGRISFTPRAGEQYSMRISEPAGISRDFPLPEVKTAGASLRATTDRYAANEPITLRVGVAGLTGACKVTLMRNADELAATNILPRDGSFSEVTLTPPSHVAGVLTATVWNEQGEPLAERLIFREPDRSLNIALTADKSRYTPGTPVSMRVRVTDQKGAPVPAAWIGMSVFDDSVMEMLETREQPPRLPAMALLESDVRELFDSQVLFERDSAKSDVAMDLLLGTQGWRRFATMRVDVFLQEYGESARRALAIRDEPIVTRGFAGRRRGGAVMLGMPDAAHPAPAAAAVERMEDEGVDFDEVAVDKEAAMAPKEAAAAPAEAPPVPPVREVAAELRPAQQAAGRRGNLLAAKRIRADDDLRGLAYLGDDFEVAQRLSPLVIVREFSHKVRPNRDVNERSDFAETLYWNAGIQTDERGEAVVSFDTSDAVTSFRVVADGHDGQGALGASHTLIESVEPFYIEPKAPLFVTAGDVIRLPIALVNGLDQTITNVATTISVSGDIATTAVDPISLSPGQRARQIIQMTIGDTVGDIDYTVHAAAGGDPFCATFEIGVYKDRVSRKLSVEAAGFPMELAFGGLLERDSAITHEFSIPDDIVRNSASTEIVVYPTPLANMTEALAALIREPYGCFEQTSSTTYPLVMAQNYFMTHSGVDSALIERSRGLLDKGYDRLTGFEC
ncbi:MAG: hypothetical protein KDA32_04430, partial [Phycisphaerales bacterium]|nr:hypothetical protein [Phycisphaerales bacterium]